MLDLLYKKLDAYIRENNPEVVLSLEAEGTYGSYLHSKLEGIGDVLASIQGEQLPAYIIEERCMAMLTEELRPSRFNYIKEVLEGEFEKQYMQMASNGMLVYEAVSIMEHCSETFEHFGFTEENEDSSLLRLAITGTINEYLEGLKM